MRAHRQIRKPRAPTGGGRGHLLRFLRLKRLVFPLHPTLRAGGHATDAEPGRQGQAGLAYCSKVSELHSARKDGTGGMAIDIDTTRALRRPLDLTALVTAVVAANATDEGVDRTGSLHSTSPPPRARSRLPGRS